MNKVKSKHDIAYLVYETINQQKYTILKVEVHPGHTFFPFSFFLFAQEERYMGTKIGKYLPLGYDI